MRNFKLRQLTEKADGAEYSTCSENNLTFLGKLWIIYSPTSVVDNYIFHKYVTLFFIFPCSWIWKSFFLFF